MIVIVCAGMASGAGEHRAWSAATPNCGPREVARLVADFSSAFNAGDQRRLREFVSGASSPGRGLVHYFVREGDGAEALGDPLPPGSRAFTARPATVLGYFARRHARGERLKIMTLRVTERYRKGVAGAFLHVSRTADDLVALGITHNTARVKAEFSCQPRRVIIWNMVMPRRPLEDRRSGCHVPKWWTGERSILSCRSENPRRIFLLAR